VGSTTGVKTVIDANFSHVDLQQFWASLSIVVVEGLAAKVSCVGDAEIPSKTRRLRSF
jgi:hypothetical protein